MAMEYRSQSIEVGSFLMPHFLTWRASVHCEHTFLFKQIADLRMQICTRSKELRLLKLDGHTKKVQRYIRAIKSMRDKLSEYETRIWFCSRTLKPMEEILDTAIESYARASCTALTQRISTKLPREMRDMVYMHLLDNEPLPCIYRVAHPKAADGKNRQFEPEDQRYRNYLDNEFVCANVLIEIQDMAMEMHKRKVDVMVKPRS